jgi:hypothetical protein
MANAAATKAQSVLTRPTFTLADRMKIQQEQIRLGNYTVIGRLVSVVFEGRRKITGLSQSRPRYANDYQAKTLPDSMKPFSQKQTELWASITLDWLSHRNAPIIALSRDHKDLLLPHGMTPLPPIPDPRWVPGHARSVCHVSKRGCEECNPPRIPQLLTGCPVVGDRVTDKITARDGHVYGILHPINALMVMLLGARGTFAQIKGAVDYADGTHMAMMLDDANPEALQGWFVGGRFEFGV